MYIRGYSRIFIQYECHCSHLVNYKLIECFSSWDPLPLATFVKITAAMFDAGIEVPANFLSQIWEVWYKYMPMCERVNGFMEITARNAADLKYL